ncbi:hypothetical protein [Brucella anthropi]|uniref:hypothetical protein n=1 Tax=Brucella anthropi TaxID=529 RepID=UPI000F683204|nr:hypothetical protein [Brucella anthropi]RRY08999.1 hypothetical protein EGJ58_14080 [Brucella anthropi]
MAYQSQFYTAGTVTVADGSAIVSGSDTGWETALIEGGVFYVLGSAYPILSVEDETKLTLAIPFSGEGAVGLTYAIDRQRSAAVSSITMNDRLAVIIASIQAAQPESDILSAFAALQGEDGKLPVFTSGDTLGLVDYIADAKGSLGKLAALELAARQLMQTDTNGALTAVNLLANKILHTGASGDITQSDITTAALVLLKLTGVAAADKLPYFNAADGTALADFTAAARALTNLSGNAANDMFPYLTGANGAALTALTAFARLFLAANNGSEMWAKMGGVRGSAFGVVYWKTPGGQLTIIGTTAGTTDSNAALTAVFPTAFANANYQIVTIGGEITIPTYNVLWDRAAGACSFQVYNTGGNPRISGAARINYIAIGDA